MSSLEYVAIVKIPSYLQIVYKSIGLFYCCVNAQSPGDKTGVSYGTHKLFNT